jgi:hypothetical protein
MGSNPLRTFAAIQTLGVSELVLRGQESEKPLESIEGQKAPPTTEEARMSADSSSLKPKTYGRAGTIKNTGGAQGLASSTLNLSSPSLMGK